MRLCQALLACLVLVGLPHTAWAKWYLLASVHPNNLVVIDTETDRVVQNIGLEGRGPALNIAPNPAHPQYAYVVNNLSQSVALVDLDEGKQVTSFWLASDTELVRTMEIDVSAQGDRLFVHERPLQKDQGSYAALDNRIRVIDLNTQQTVRTFPAPRQVMSLASSKDGGRLYVFSVGQDIFVYDTETGHQLDRLPLLNRNITGLGRTDGLPLVNPYQEHGYLVSFGTFVTDTITGQVTLGMASLDLSAADPEVEVVEFQPFAPESCVLTGALSPTTGKAYFAYNRLWRVNPQTRRIEKSSPLPNAYFTPLIHPQGTKLYCGSNWHDVAVFDAESLELLAKIELGATQTGGGHVLRFVER